MRYRSLVISISMLCVWLIMPTAAALDSPTPDTPTPDAPAAKRQMIIVVGAEGTPEYGVQFTVSASQWAELGKQAEMTVTEIGTDSVNSTADLDQLKKAIESLSASSANSDQPHWLIFIGHGTFQANVAKFNLRGPDLSSEQFAAWLKPVENPLVIINGSSSSGPFVNALSGPARIVVTATKSGEEQNFARFGVFLPKVLGDVAADLDHDDEVSLLEAVIKASSETGDFYTSEGRIRTEHAIVDDNGDKLGTPAEMLGSVLRGTPLSAAASPKNTAPPPQLDGEIASKTILIPSQNAPQWLPAEIKERNRIENELSDLRRKKPTMGEDAYYAELEKWMLELAEIYRQADQREAENKEPTE
jgi:hypothetical protein